MCNDTLLIMLPTAMSCTSNDDMAGGPCVSVRFHDNVLLFGALTECTVQILMDSFKVVSSVPDASTASSTSTQQKKSINASLN